MLNMLRAPVGNMRIFIRIQIRILHVQSADPQIHIIPIAQQTLSLGCHIHNVTYFMLSLTLVMGCACQLVIKENDDDDDD